MIDPLCAIRRVPARRARLAAALAFAAGLGSAFPSAATAAEATQLSGREVVAANCARCHEKGVKGAPRIGSSKDWIGRASEGLSGLTGHALNGIRDMPAHGGNLKLSDFEIKLAVTDMVNRSGGKWQVPIDKSAPPAARTGAEIVNAQCSKCHQEGKFGAPKIGDRAAWIPRLKYGLDNTIRSAMNGHGAMPARGGLPDLTDAELRSAVLYLFRGPETTAKKK